MHKLKSLLKKVLRKIAFRHHAFDDIKFYSHIPNQEHFTLCFKRTAFQQIIRLKKIRSF